MDNVIWKAFKLSNHFLRQTPPSTNTPAKELNISDEPFANSIALITRAESNNGIKGYIEKGDFPTLSNKITYNDQFSLFLFHNYEFTTIKDHLSIFVPKNNHLRQILDSNTSINVFLVTILNRIFSKDIFNYNFTGSDYKFDRELILLPCLEVEKDDEYIWEENGHYYTLAVEYIKHLMDEAKELREQKTIHLYEAERAKYEEGYEREKNLLVWKGFRIGDFLSFSSSHVIKDQIKNLQVFSSYEEGTVANVTASKENNGIVGYIEENEEISKRKLKSVLTIASDAAYAGICFYQPNYVVSTGHNKVIDITIPNLKLLFEKNEILYMFLASIITKNFCKTFYGFSKSITDNDFKKTLILLPCLEVEKDDEYIWEENGHYYTLAVEYISYIYLTGKMENSKKKIDNYTYQY